MTYHCKGSNKGLFGGTAKTLPTAARHLIDALKVILTEKDIPDSASGFFGILWYFIEDKLHFWNYWYYCSIIVFVLFVVCHSRISSVSRGLDCSRAGGRGFDSQSRAITQGLKITDKWRYSLCTASGLTFAPGSDVHIKWLSRLKL